jgi:integrase
MAVEKLTAAAIRDPKPGRRGDGGGLWLETDPSGAKRWVFRYMLRGAAREMGLGNLSTYTAPEARERAREARKLLDRGVDPIEHRKAEQEKQDRAAEATAAAAITFGECADRFYGLRSKKWSAIHARQWRQKLTDYILPKLGKLQVRALEIDDILRAVQPIWEEKPNSASKTRGQIEDVISWATAHGYRKQEDGTSLPNPASWDLLQHRLTRPSDLRDVEHLPALDYHDAAEFLARLREKQDLRARALEFTILCASRTDETLEAKRSAIDFRRRLWIIPKNDAKNRREHRVPLSDRAMGIINELPADERGYLFPGDGAHGRFPPSTMLDYLRDVMGEKVVTVHGFRTTFRTWGQECTEYPHELLEIALNHTQPDEVVRAYARGDALLKRRRCMEEWARFVSTPYVDAEVHELRRSA